PYYLAPSNKDAVEGFYLIREGLKRSAVAAVAQAVLFRRVHSLLLRAHGPGLIATMLHYYYQGRSAEDAFDEIPRLSIKKEMLELAKHIITTKSGEYDPKTYDDRYESALAELVKAKLEGKPLRLRQPKEGGKVIDLMDALRRSAGKEPAHKKATAGRPR